MDEAEIAWRKSRTGKIYNTQTGQIVERINRAIDCQILSLRVLREEETNFFFINEKGIHHRVPRKALKEKIWSHV